MLAAASVVSVKEDGQEFVQSSRILARCPVGISSRVNLALHYNPDNARFRYFRLDSTFENVDDERITAAKELKSITAQQ